MTPLLLRVLCNLSSRKDTKWNTIIIRATGKHGNVGTETGMGTEMGRDALNGSPGPTRVE